MKSEYVGDKTVYTREMEYGSSAAIRKQRCYTLLRVTWCHS